MKLFQGSIFFLAFVGFATFASAQTIWTGTAGDNAFENSGNWSSGVPNATTDAIVPGSATINQTTPQQNAQTLAFQGGTVNLNLAGGSTLTISGNTPSSTGTNSGVTGGAIVNFSGGTLVFNDGVFYVGNSSNGTLNLQSGNLNYDVQTTSDATQINVGHGATGTVTQSGSSSVTMGEVLFVGTEGGTGTYNLTGNSSLQTGSLLNTYIIAVGADGLANTTGTNGTLTISDNSSLNLNPGGQLQVGTDSKLFPTATNPNPTFPTSVHSVGVVTQSGSSTVNIIGSAANFSGAFVGTANGATGTYNLQGGNFHLGNFAELIVGDVSGATGIFNQSGGFFTDTTGSFTSVGESGTGTYNLSSGSTDIQGELFIGDNAGSVGVFSQSGGTFTGEATSVIEIGESGQGSYNLSGGTADFIDGFTVGDNSGSHGFVNQSGGTLTAENVVTIGNAGNGTYNLSGGTATFNSGVVVGSAGSVNQTGGTFIVPLGQTLDLSTTGSSYNLSGGILQIGNDGTTNGIVGTSGQGHFNFGGGTLQVLSGSTADLVDGLDGTVSGNSTLDTTNANIDLTGNLSGGGGLTIIGGNAVTLAPTTGDTYSGPTIISNGTLFAAASTFSPSSSVSIDSNGAGATGTFNLDGSGGSNFLNGNISSVGNAGTGIFNIFFGANTDTLGLTGTTTFNGTTTLSGGGTVEFFNGTISNIGGTGNVGIGDSGFLTGGIVRLIGNNTYAGSTTINPSYTLYTNNLPGDVANNGTMGIDPTSPTATATISIGGNLTSTGGVFLVRSVGNAADLYSVTGNVDMASTSGNEIKLTGFGSTTTPLTIVSGGSVNATLPTLVVAGANVLFTASLAQNGSAYQLTTTQLPTATYAITPNQMAVAGGIDNVLVNPGTVFMGSAPPANFVTLANALNNLTAAQIPGVLDQLSPESLQYSRDIAFENATFLAQNVDGHLADLRSGYSGLDTSKLTFAIPGFDNSLDHSLGSLLAYNSPAPNGVDYYPTDDDYLTPNTHDHSISDSPNPYTSPSLHTAKWNAPNFSEFISGDVILADLNRNQSTAYAPPSKASYTAGDATAGISFRMTNNLAAGVLFDYNHTDAKTDSSGSRTKVDTYAPGLFGTFFEGGFYLNGLASFGYNDYANTRNISMLGATASSSPTGYQYVGNLDGGYDFHPNKHWSLGPTLGATYTHLDVDSFTETGAGAADLAVNGQHADSFRSRLGAHADYVIHTGPVLLQPNFSLAWQHEYLDDSSGITSQLNVPGSSAFTIQTAAPSRDSALIALGATATLDNSMALYLNYVANVGAEDYFAQSVEGGFKARF